MVDEYKVISTDELTRLSDTRGVEQYYRLRIKTKGGVVITVEIDEKDFTPEKAGPVLLERAKNADQIMKLKG